MKGTEPPAYSGLRKFKSQGMYCIELYIYDHDMHPISTHVLGTFLTKKERDAYYTACYYAIAYAFTDEAFHQKWLKKRGQTYAKEKK